MGIRGQSRVGSQTFGNAFKFKWNFGFERMWWTIIWCLVGSSWINNCWAWTAIYFNSTSVISEKLKIAETNHFDRKAPKRSIFFDQFCIFWNSQINCRQNVGLCEKCKTRINWINFIRKLWILQKMSRVFSFLTIFYSKGPADLCAPIDVI